MTVSSNKPHINEGRIMTRETSVQL